MLLTGQRWVPIKKHNLTDSSIIAAVVGDPESSGLEDAAADRWWYRGPWQHRQCTSGGECRVIDQVWIRVIVEFQTWQSAPAQGEVGVITAYCEGMARCPEWLNQLPAR